LFRRDALNFNEVSDDDDERVGKEFKKYSGDTVPNTN
jgi:hypothetical protein